MDRGIMYGNVTRELNLLLLEQRADDGALVKRALRGAGMSGRLRRVACEADFVAALESCPDVILASRGRSGFSGLAALELVRQRGLDTPFILLLEAEEDGLEQRVLGIGADDSLFKDRLGRLAAAIMQALEQRALIRELHDARHAAAQSQERFRETFEQAAVGLTRVDFNGALVEVNQKFCDMLGYAREELLGTSVRDITHPDDYGAGKRFREQVTRGEMKSVAGEKRYLHKDGSIVWARRTLSVARDEAGNPQYVISVVEDISDRKRAEDAVLQERALLRAVVDAMPERIYVKDREGRFLLQNATNMKVRGVLNHEDIVGKTVFDVFPREAAERLHAEDQAVMDSGAPLINREGQTFFGGSGGSRGETRWHVTSKVPLKDAAGNVFGVVGVNRDITDRKRAEEELYRKNALTSLLESMAIAANQAHDPVEAMRACLTRIREFIGWPVGHGVIFNGIPGDEDKQVSLWVLEQAERWGTFQRASEPFSYYGGSGGLIDSLIKTKRALWLKDISQAGAFRRAEAARECGIKSGFAFPVIAGDRVVAFLEFYSDVATDVDESLLKVVNTIGAQLGRVSERREAEDALRESEERYRHLFELAPLPLLVLDEATLKLLAANHAAVEKYGYSAEEFLSMTILDLQAEEDREQVARQLRERNPLANAQFQRRHVTKSGALILAEVSARPFVFHGRKARMLLVNDVTERRRAEQALRDSEERSRAMFEQATVGITISALDLQYIQVNDKYCDIVGYPREELLRMSVRDVNFKENLEGAVDYRHKLFTGEIGSMVREKQLRRKDGSPVWVSMVTSVIRDSGGEPKHFISVIQDISVRKAAERRIMRLNRLYSALTQTNEAIVRIKDRETLFGEICRIAVEQGQLQLAWIGLLDRETGLVKPVTHAGSGHGYLRGLRISASADVPEGCGPSGIAMREDRTIVCNDTQRDPVFGPWSEQASAEGIRSSATVPLKLRDQTIGVLVLMAGETEFFDPELVHLLNDMAKDISFALDNFELETEHRRGQLALLESEEKFRQLADNIGEIFWMTDAGQNDLVYLSPAYEKITGQPVLDVQKNPRDWLKAVHPDDRDRVRAGRNALPSGEYDLEYRIMRPDGGVRWIHDQAYPVHDAAGNIYRIAGIASDITERKEAEERLVHLAHYDGLTGLPNRVLYYDRLKQTLAQARRHEWVVATMFLDLDRFKVANDTLGHAIGDQLLKQVAERLNRCVRTVDTVGRLSGDEFGVILCDLRNTEDARLVAQKILKVFKEPFQLDRHEIYVTASIGISMYPSDSEDAEVLMKAADTAMYRAKDAGRNNFQFYTSEMNVHAFHRLDLENNLRRALERREFLLYYQPKASLGSGKITGFEALLRWQRPELGLVPPAEFVPMLEETGLIVPVGEWVLGAACAQIKAWEAAGLQPVPIAINLSARQFSAKDLGATVKRILEEHRVDPLLIELEITESSLMVNTEEAEQTLEYLNALGVSLAIDDFGTGYSSLGYLKRFPLDALKIDRSFIRDITTSIDDATITRAVIGMAHNLGLKVTAEGVETEAQTAFLAANACDEIQGFYFAKPLPAEACALLLREERRLKLPTVLSGSQAPTLLLVDDDEDQMLLLKRQLERDGYFILTARDAEEGLQLFRQYRIDVVISDQQMPGMSGVEFLQRVKLLYPMTVRLMLSGHDDFQTVTDAINKSEIMRFLPKNMEPQQIRTYIRQAMLSHARPFAASAQRSLPVAKRRIGPAPDRRL